MRASSGAVPAPRAASPRSWWAEAMHNRIIALVLAMIIAVPLLAAPADHSRNGVAALTIEALALVLMTALLWRTQWDLRPASVRRFLTTSANAPILLLIGLVALSCAFSPAKVLSVQELLRTGSGVLLYFVAAYQFRQSKHLSMLASTLLFLSALVAFGGMAEYQLQSLNRANALFGDPQPLGSFLMLLLPVVAALAYTDKNTRRRMVAQVTVILMIGCLMLTQGRSAWLGSIAGLATLAWLATRPLPGQVKKREPLRFRKHQLVWPAMFVLIAAGFLFAMQSQNGTISNRAFTIGKLGTDVSWQSRVQHNWKGAVEMIAARPFFGWGTGLYPLYQHQFTGQGFAIKSAGGYRISLAEQAHNFYLQTAAELGVPGLLLVVAVLGCFLYSGFKRVREMEPGIRRTLLMASLAATVGFAVDAFSSPSWQYGQVSIFFWLVMGMGTSCLRPRVKREESQIVMHLPSRGVNLWLTRPAAVATALGIATLLPSVQASADSSGYNNNSGGGGGTSTLTKVGRVALGSAAVAGVLYGLDALFGTVPEGTEVAVTEADANITSDKSATLASNNAVTKPATTVAQNPTTATP